MQVVQQRLEFLPADGVASDEVAVDQAVAPEHVEQREGEGRVAAGERLQVQVGGLGRLGADRVDDDFGAGAGRNQCSKAWGAEDAGLAPQTMMQAASRTVRGSNPSNEVP